MVYISVINTQTLQIDCPIFKYWSLVEEGYVDHFYEITIFLYPTTFLHVDQLPKVSI